jgi:predicted DNA-binding transcriptional regulator YafY
MDPQKQRRDAQRDTQGQWSRAIWLDARTRAGSHPNIAALQEKFEVSRRTAFNTVAFLRDSLGAPLAYNRARRGYHYTDPTYTLPALFLQEGELLALLLAQQVTHQYLGTPLEAPLRAAIAKIRRYLPDEALVPLQDVADAFQFAGGSSVEVPLQLMADLRRAVRERCLLRVRYYTASRDETGERDIEPHFLTNIRGDWMVVAWDRWRNEDRVFMLARIQQHQPLDERFTPRPALTPATYSRDTFLTEHGAAPYAVVLRFDAYQACWIRERTWHPSQQIEEHADGSLILRLTIAGEGDLLRWIRAMGATSRCASPPGCGSGWRGKCEDR